MQIRQRLKINSAIMILSIAALIGSLAVSTLRINSAMERIQLADELTNVQYERLALRTDYMRSGTERAREQTQAKNRQVSQLLKTIAEKFAAPEDQEIIAQLVHNQETVGILFRAILSNRREAAANMRNPVLAAETENRLVSQLNMQVYEAAILGSKLQESSNASFASTIKTAGALGVILLLLVSAAVLVNSTTMSRAITSRIGRLRQGAAMIGEGNLDYRIEMEGNDEFGELSAAFDNMALKLSASNEAILKEMDERKRSEEALRESETRFALLSETAGALLVTTDPQTLLEELCRKVMLHLDCDVFFNFMVDESAGRLRLNAYAGIPEEEARKIEWLDYGIAVCGCVARDHLRMIAEDISHTPDARTELVKSYGVQAYCCHPLMAGDRLIGTLSFGATRRARFSAEDVQLMQAVSHQVSAAMERIQREEALSESENRLNRAQEIAHLGSWDLDLVSNVLIWSDEVYRIFGLKPQEFGATYEAFLEAVHPEDRQAVNDAYSSSVREGRDSYEIEHRVIQRSTGDIRNVLERCEHFRDDTGKIIRSVGMVHDITERKQAEEALRRRTEELETLMDVAPVAIWVANDPQCNEIVGNRMANAFYHAMKGENVSANVSSVLRFFKDVEELQPEELPLQKAASTNADVRNVNLDVLLANDTWLSMLGSASPLRDETGQVRGCIGGFVDVTDLKQAQQDLKQFNATLESRIRERTYELEAVNRELESFSYSVSHDLRAPLRTIDGFTQILLEKYQSVLDERGQDYMRRVRNATARMEKLIDDLLRLSRLGQRNMVYETVDLSGMADSVMQGLKESNPERKVESVIQPRLVVRGDRELIRIALENLLGNAFKFTRDRDDARIEFGSIEAGGEKTFYVRDNGAGFDPSYSAKLFRPFQRLHNEKEFPGTGIGLAIVQRIVSRHGGRIWAESQIDQGATFYFTISEEEPN